MVRLRFAAAAAFLTLRFAAARYFVDAMMPSFQRLAASGLVDGIPARGRGEARYGARRFALSRPPV
jgi:hypothetical protein